MSEFNTALLIANLYRYLLILAGIFLGFMGYRLFVRGVYDRAGDLHAGWGDNKILLKRAAPGTFFVGFAVVVTAIAIWRPVTLERYPSGTGAQNQRDVVSTIPLPIAAILSKAIEGEPLSDDEHTAARKWLDTNTSVSTAPEMRIEGTNPVKAKKKGVSPVREEQPKPK